MNNKLKIITGGAFALVLVVILFFTGFPITIVQAGHRGVPHRFGEVFDWTVGEGIHWVGFFTRVTHFEVRTRKMEVGADSASKDLQSVQTTIALNYHLDPGNVNKLYQEIGVLYNDRILQPAIQESVKAVTAQFTAEELITKRPEVKMLIRQELENRLHGRYIMVDEFSIVDFAFSEGFDEAIELKQTAEQQALKAERDLERVKLEAQQQIEQAKAEAEALRLQKQQITPDLVQLRWIEKWNGQMPQYMGSMTPFVGLNMSAWQ
jgi:regulator of protease activity HflC (stomatin/prohibitin superfamily)